MSRRSKKADTVLLATVIIAAVFGFVIFLSAALGLYARDGGEFAGVVTMQIASIVLGFGALVLASNIPYTFWKKYALGIFIFATVLMVIVLIPQISFFHGGSRRWILLGPVSVQPGEFFKVAAVIFYAALLVKHRKHIKKWQSGILPFAFVAGLSAVLYLAQPKVGTLVVVALALGSMLLVSGARLRHIGALSLALVPLAGLALLALPYARERIEVYLNPETEPLGAGYQIEQSLIAVGSGEWFGRGYGQSIQKFSFLPEPIGDSIFSVAAEELGFFGAAVIIALFLVFAYRGFVIASRAPDYFSRLLVLGLVILIVAQSFINIGAMLGLAPLTGLPLIFISHGGSAMLSALASVGIILNVSKYRKS